MKRFFVGQIRVAIFLSMMKIVAQFGARTATGAATLALSDKGPRN